MRVRVKMFTENYIRGRGERVAIRELIIEVMKPNGRAVLFICAHEANVEWSCLVGKGNVGGRKRLFLIINFRPGVDFVLGTLLIRCMGQIFFYTLIR